MSLLHLVFTILYYLIISKWINCGNRTPCGLICLLVSISLAPDGKNCFVHRNKLALLRKVHVGALPRLAFFCVYCLPLFINYVTLYLSCNEMIFDDYYRLITGNHVAAIYHKHWCEAALDKLDCLRKGGDSRVSGCTRLHCRVMLI